MDSGKRNEPEMTARGRILVGTPGIIFGSAVFGAVATVLVLRAMQGGVETISTTALLSFLLTMILSVVAMVLAVVAISVSRTAERAISQKSAEMNAMRMSIERVESSVLHIGEEIADSIYDNFEILSEELRESLLSHDMPCADMTGAVEQSSAQAVTIDEQQENQTQPEETGFVEENPVPVIPALPVSEPVTDGMREKADKKYGEFKDIVLLGVANYPGVISRKIGEGHYRTEGDELVDGVFVIQNEKVAVCTFCINDTIVDRFIGETGDSFNGFLRSLFNELKRGHFTRVFLVFDGQLTNTSLYAGALNGLSGRIDAETFSRYELFEGTPDIVIPELTERVSQLMEEPPAAEEETVPELSFRRQVGA
ncbi:MAG: hypothetical protein HOO88_06910 [Kiritimatiellaceae bacterium]|nr:hypothetical protein [Kiritimatiellaceae bacterium]